MTDAEGVWKPGSFTKNFSWGKSQSGLSELHTVIRVGFDDKLEDVPRELFRERVKTTGRPDYIPINFFLFNRVESGTSLICADELVFQALTWNHGVAFDRVALFAFLFSYAGSWKGARKEQRRPAMWANAYVRKRLALEFNWNAKNVNADDIERFVANNPQYQAETTRKLSTNLNYLLHIGKIQEFAEPRVSRWWVDCLFLALDRLIENARIDKKNPKGASYPTMLGQSGFLELTGGSTMEKNLALKHLVRLYLALGGRSRLSDAAVMERTREEIPNAYPALPNDQRPRGAIHLTNPKILKSIQPACADLARFAGFDVISPDEMEELQIKDFIKLRTSAALAVLRDRGIRPTMTLDELLHITRDE